MNLPFRNSDYISGIALRPSIAIGFMAGAVQIPLLRIAIGLGLSDLLIYGLISALLTGILSYFIIQAFHEKRVETLVGILKNIAEKEFRNYSYLKSRNKDELDEALRQAIRVSADIETELKNMAETENYRKEFIGDISHELKTPIFAIQGFIETLLDGAIDDEDVNRRFLQKTMRNVNRLIYLTQDLMEISRLESGELESEFRSINLRDLIHDVTESLRHQAEQSDIDLQLESIDPDLTVYADRHQIRRVLTNLIDNAIKYNRENGRVTIGVKPYSSGERQKRVLVYVEDTGIGIDEESIDRVTERFYRVDKSRSRERGGTGLGLSIIKHIMEVHGEELFIESTPGEGSTFSFTLTQVHYPSV